MDMPPGIEHMRAAEVEGNIQSMGDAVDQARKIANLENPDQDTGVRVIETRDAKTSISWEKDEVSGTLTAHITFEKDGKTETKDAKFFDMTGGKGDNPVYEEGIGPVASR
jgi:hypothetical protein